VGPMFETALMAFVSALVVFLLGMMLNMISSQRKEIKELRESMDGKVPQPYCVREMERVADKMDKAAVDIGKTTSELRSEFKELAKEIRDEIRKMGESKK